MDLLGNLFNRALKLGKIQKKKKRSPHEKQRKVLKKLLIRSCETQFGIFYQFSEIIQQFKSKDTHAFYELYKRRVPIYSYNKIFNEWWYRSKAGEADVTWPGKVNYFALSSGTSEASTKHIPITNSIIKANKKTSIRQLLSLVNYKLPRELLGKGILMLGGSTYLNKTETYYEGDLSGIQASKIPFWFQFFYKPGTKIARNRDWESKLNEIVESAPKWDIGFIVGVPAWLQIMMERIIERYQLKTIHDIWPNLTVFVHGGVSFEPYKKGFEKLLAHPMIYIETYLASEGFIAYQSGPDKKSMKLVVNNGIFFEFIPFNDVNITAEGEVVAHPETLMIDEVTEGVDYVILLSTCAGTWRYVIGDVVRFTDKEACEIIITGRTKHYLSLCGEHLSVDNMNHAIQMVSEELNISIKEFAVAGVPNGSLFAHQWYIGTDDVVDAEQLKQLLDEKLKVLNDDYRVERIAALKEVFVTVLPTNVFYDWMKVRGKEGGQNKFPRVLNKKLHQEWEEYISVK
ncbi:MAG: GH3 auxin-responsive promoter family protein [Cytophagales bacterium]|nr:GH3 auxin-responsive promoter family protein [Cytophaga sp.]